MTPMASSAESRPAPNPTNPPGEPRTELAVRAAILELHGRCVHEPREGLAAAHAFQQQLAARGDLAAEWMPLLQGAVENAIAAAEHRLSRPHEAEARVRRVVESLNKNTWLHATPAWHEQHDQIFATAVRLLAVVLDDQGRHAEALTWHREAIATYERLGDLLNQGRGWHNLSILYARTMLFGEALAAMKRSATLLEGTADPDRFREFAMWTHQADVLMEMGDPAGAETAARRAIETTLTPGRMFDRGEPHAVLGAALLRQGRMAEAVATLHEAKRRLEKQGHCIGLAQVHSHLARAAAATDPDAARELMAAAVRIATEARALTDAAGYQAWIARSYLENGDVTRALELARAALRQFPSNPGVDRAELDLRLVLAEALAATGDAAAAYAAHRDYHERFATAHDQRKTLQAQILAAEYAVSLAQRDAAHARLENARLNEALVEIAARLDGAQPGPSAVVNAGQITPEALRPLGLRPRECEVLHWVVHGKSNEEIGIILGCSTETVKSHLKRIYTQLDVTNRTSAAARALAGATPSA